MPTSSGPGKRTGVGAGWLHFSEYSIMLLCVATSVLLLPLVTTIIYNRTKIVCCITFSNTHAMRMDISRDKGKGGEGRIIISLANSKIYYNNHVKNMMKYM